jgi:hypothetical protein
MMERDIARARAELLPVLVIRQLLQPHRIPVEAGHGRHIGGEDDDPPHLELHRFVSFDLRKRRQQVRFF